MFAFFADWCRLFHVAFRLSSCARLVSLEVWRSFPFVLRIFLLLASNPFIKVQERGKKLGEILQRLGPAYIKFGQFLSTRPDIIGIELARDLSYLKDDLPPFSSKTAQKTLFEEFGESSRSLFPELPEAFAAASVAQVHCVETPEGERAVKVLRPRIEGLIRRELRALARGARALERFFPSSRRLEPSAFIRTIGDSMRKELDLRMEASSADEFSSIASAGGFFCIPAVDWRRTGRRVLTLEWVDGIPLTREHVLENRNISELANCVTRGFLASALDHGVFHADIHEGNMLVLSEAAAARAGTSLALVDFGIMGRIDRGQRRFLAEVLHGFLKRDYARIAQVHFDAGYVPADRDLAEFSHALRGIGEPVFGVSAEDISMGHVLIRLFETTREFGMHLRPELVLLQKTMVQVEGVARSIDSKHDIWEAASPVVNRWIAREFGPRGISRMAREALVRTHRELVRLPALMDKLERGLTPVSEARKFSFVERLLWLGAGVALASGVWWALRFLAW